MTKTTTPLNFIDLFSGAGGLSCGLELAGMKCVLGVDMDKNAIETFKANHHFASAYCGSIVDLTAAKIRELTKGQEIHAVVGGPPCQGFSTVGLGNPNDTRNMLFKEFIRVVKITNPQYVVIENVTGLLAKKNEKTIQAIFSIFSKMGYTLDVQVMSSENYGVPEKRRRTIIIGSRLNQTITFPQTMSKVMTVGEAFKNLKATNGKYLNHDIEAAKIKNKIDQERIACVPEGKGVRYEADEKAYFKKKKLKLGVNWKELRENRFRQTKYQRLDRKKPSPTIMTHRHNYFHPTENRYLTQREAASLQSFPNDFQFYGPLSAQWRQIGNAVPPLLGRAIGNAILAMHAEKSASKKKSVKKSVGAKDLVLSVRKKAFLYKEATIS